MLNFTITKNEQVLKIKSSLLSIKIDFNQVEESTAKVLELLKLFKAFIPSFNEDSLIGIPQITNLFTTMLSCYEGGKYTITFSIDTKLGKIIIKDIVMEDCTIDILKMCSIVNDTLNPTEEI